MSIFDFLRGQAKAFESRIERAEEVGAAIEAKLDSLVAQGVKFENAIAALYERALTLEKDYARKLDAGGGDVAKRVEDAATEFMKLVDGLTKEDGRVWKAIERIEKRMNDRIVQLAKAVEALEKEQAE